MKKIMLVALTMAMAASVGCQNNKKSALSEVPPPPPAMEPVSMEPVQVEPVQTVPAYTEPVPMTDTQATSGNTYTVKKGDTIFSIARSVYGSNSRAKDIIAANPGIDPNKIKVGQTLVLP